MTKTTSSIRYLICEQITLLFSHSFSRFVNYDNYSNIRIIRCVVCQKSASPKITSNVMCFRRRSGHALTHTLSLAHATRGRSRQKVTMRCNAIIISKVIRSFSFFSFYYNYYLLIFVVFCLSYCLTIHFLSLSLRLFAAKLQYYRRLWCWFECLCVCVVSSVSPFSLPLPLSPHNCLSLSLFACHLCVNTHARLITKRQWAQIEDSFHFENQSNQCITSWRSRYSSSHSLILLHD